MNKADLRDHGEAAAGRSARRRLGLGAGRRRPARRCWRASSDAARCRAGARQLRAAVRSRRRRGVAATQRARGRGVLLRRRGDRDRAGAAEASRDSSTSSFPAPRGAARSRCVRDVLNVPNVLTLLRLLAIPVFLILLVDFRYREALGGLRRRGRDRRARRCHRAAHAHEDHARRLPRSGGGQAAAHVGVRRAGLPAAGAALARGDRPVARRDAGRRLLPALHHDPARHGGAAVGRGQAEHLPPAQCGGGRARLAACIRAPSLPSRRPRSSSPPASSPRARGCST